jgi:hypothetical protein
MNKQEEFNKYIITNNVRKIKSLINDMSINPEKKDNWAIGYASKKGYNKIFKLLLSDPRVDPSDNYNYAFIESYSNGHNDTVEILLTDKRIDPSMQNNSAIGNASHNRDFDLLKILLKDPRVDPSADHNYSIIHADDEENNITELLWCDPRFKNTLKKDDLELYNKLIKIDIKNKINEF